MQRHAEHGVEPAAAVAQPFGEHRDRPTGTVAQSRARHPQRQRKPAALAQHLADRVTFGQVGP
jgi:hypothetical protein